MPRGLAKFGLFAREESVTAPRKIKHAQSSKPIRRIFRFRAGPSGKATDAEWPEHRFMSLNGISHAKFKTDALPAMSFKSYLSSGPVRNMRDRRVGKGTPLLLTGTGTNILELGGNQNQEIIITSFRALMEGLSCLIIEFFPLKVFFAIVGVGWRWV